MMKSKMREVMKGTGKVMTDTNEPIPFEDWLMFSE